VSSPASPFPHAALRALLDRIIPEDDVPGALGAGVEEYVMRQLAGDCAAEAPLVSLGLSQLDAEARARSGGNSFAFLDSARQDELLRDLEAGRVVTRWPDGLAPAGFFLRMIELAQEGYYADPSNGGNRGATSWRTIGYDPGRI